jgi:hypothetical protein
MEKIIFYDWYKGFNPIAFNKLLRKHLDYSLSQAKQAADELLAGHLVVIAVTSQLNISEFLSETINIGAEGSLIVDRIQIAEVVEQQIEKLLTHSIHKK